MMNFEYMFGNYYTRTFCDIFPDFNTFKAEYVESELDDTRATITEASLKSLYYLLYARYGNSHTIFYDENQFKYNVFSLIFMYGPTWERRLELQHKLRSLTEDELTTGSTTSQTHAYNPSSLSPEEINYINEQNKTKYVKSKMEGLSMGAQHLEKDVTKEFLDRFQSLFIRILVPNVPLYYQTNLPDITQGDDE